MLFKEFTGQDNSKCYLRPEWKYLKAGGVLRLACSAECPRMYRPLHPSGAHAPPGGPHASVLTADPLFIMTPGLTNLETGRPEEGRRRRGHLAGSVVERLPSAPGVIPGSWDRVPHRAPQGACFSLCLSLPLSLSLRFMNK